MDLSICTFNINNLYSRYRFGKKIPGVKTPKPSAGADSGFSSGFIPWQFQVLPTVKRKLAALSIGRGSGFYPDMLCLQEVESLPALRRFNGKHLNAVYSHMILIESQDIRRIHTGILSARPLCCLRSHLHLRDPEPDDPKKPFLFPRDCIEVDISGGSDRNEKVTFLVCHFKSGLEKSEESVEQAQAFRQRQAEGVVEILKERFPGSAFDTGLFAVVGDLNDHPDSESLRPLTRESGMVSAMERIEDPRDRWTYWLRKKNAVFPFDQILLSPRLDEKSAGSLPEIERRGIGFRRYVKKKLQGPRRVYRYQPGDGEPGRIDFQFERFDDVTPKFQASDHCPVFFSL